MILLSRPPVPGLFLDEMMVLTAAPVGDHDGEVSEEAAYCE